MIMTQKKLLMIVNPTAGKKKSRGPLFDAAAILSQAGYLISIHNTAFPGDAFQTAATLGKEYDVVVAVGGDGTLNQVVSGIMTLNPRPLVGYLAQGSTNDFAASLQIPRNPASAAKLIANGTPFQLDLGRWNNRHFVYVASFGAFTQSSYTAPQTAKNTLGHLAYVLEGVKDLNSLRPYYLKITADGEVLDGNYLFGAICNSTSIGGLMHLNREHVILDDGKFEMLLIPKPKSPAELPNLILNLLDQEFSYEGLVFRHVSSIHVETAEDLPWSLDGEYAASMPVIDIVNRQQSLTMLL